MELDSPLNSLEVFGMLIEFIGEWPLLTIICLASYGVANPKSDLDLVILVSPDTYIPSGISIFTNSE